MIVAVAVVAFALEPPTIQPTEQPIVAPNGRVKFIDEAQIPAEIAGTVVDMLVKEGQSVKKGRVLARLRDTIATLEVKSKKLAAENTAGIEAADAKVRSAEVKLEIEKRLVSSGGNTRIEILDKEIQLDVARAEAKNERARKEAAQADYEKVVAALDDTFVKSPFDGVVQQRIKKLGEAVQQHEPIVHIVRTDRLYVESTIDLAAANRIQVGDAVEVAPNIRAAPIATFPHLTPVHAVVILPDGKRLAAGSDDGMVTIWNLASGSRERWFAAASRRAVRALAAIPARSDELIVGGDDGSLRIWNIATGEAVATLIESSPRIDPNTAVNSLAVIDADAAQIVAGLGDGTVRVLTRDDSAATRSFRDHLARVTYLSARGEVVLSAADDGEIHLRDRQGDSTPRIFRGRSGPMGRPVGQLDWSSDGKELLFTSFSLLQIRRSDDGLPLHEWHGPRSFAGAAVFARNGACVMTADEEGEIQLWERPSRMKPARMARTFDGHAQGTQVSSIAVAANGDFAASAGSDRTVRLWRLPDQQTLDGERLKGRVSFVSTQAERGGEKRSFTVEVDDHAGKLLPNASATVVVYSGRRP